MTVNDLVRSWTKGAVATATSVVRHPIGSAAMAAGLVKGTAEVGAGLVRGSLRGTPTTDLPAQRGATAVAAGTAPAAESPGGAREPEVVPKPVPEIDELPEPVVIRADDAYHEGGEEFHDEPKAVSRESEHGDRSGDRAEIDGHLEELELAGDDDAPVWTSEAVAGAEPEEESLLDAGTAKAIRSETYMLRKAAEQRVE